LALITLFVALGNRNVLKGVNSAYPLVMVMVESLCELSGLLFGFFSDNSGDKNQQNP
jgi:hypothetical protein